MMTVAVLSACDKSDVENPVVEVDNSVVEVDNSEVEDLEIEADNGYMKTSLNNEDLDELDNILLPKSFRYERYRWDGEDVDEVGDYSYPEGSNVLLPIMATRVSREIQSSAIEDGMIYTNAAVTLDDGTQFMVLYVNDPETLEYVAASVSNDQFTTLYTFAY